MIQFDFFWIMRICLYTPHDGYSLTLVQWSVTLCNGELRAQSSDCVEGTIPHPNSLNSQLVNYNCTFKRSLWVAQKVCCTVLAYGRVARVVSNNMSYVIVHDFFLVVMHAHLCSCVGVWNVLRGCVSVLEIVFVGQCEVCVCLDLYIFFFFSLSRDAHRSANGVPVL